MFSAFKTAIYEQQTRKHTSSLPCSIFFLLGQSISFGAWYGRPPNSSTNAPVGATIVWPAEPPPDHRHGMVALLRQKAGELRQTNPFCVRVRAPATYFTQNWRRARNRNLRFDSVWSGSLQTLVGAGAGTVWHLAAPWPGQRGRP